MDDALFGRYRLEESLGRGDTSERHRAVDTARGRPVAIKVFSAERSADTAFATRFERESRMVAGLSEPHVAVVHDVGMVDGRLFLETALIDGCDLDALVASAGPLPPARAVSIVGQVAAALDAAHAEGIVHRAVKPANVLVSGSGEGFAHVVDFGAVPTGPGPHTAPELLSGGLVDHRADVYSLGCLLHTLLTGRPPTPSEHPGVPTELDDVVARAMAAEPSARFGSAGGLAAAAYAALAATPARTPAAIVAVDEQAAAVAAPLQPAGRFRTWAWVGGAVVVAVAAAVLVAVLGRGIMAATASAAPSPTSVVNHPNGPTLDG